jgi:hypothetical protein
MKRLMVSLGVMLLGIVFCVAPSHAVCALADGPYATVTKYYTGKNKVMERWECADDGGIYHSGNGVCFYNYLNNERDHEYICISGEFKIVFPLNYSP